MVRVEESECVLSKFSKSEGCNYNAIVDHSGCRVRAAIALHTAAGGCCSWRLLQQKMAESLRKSKTISRIYRRYSRDFSHRPKNPIRSTICCNYASTPKAAICRSDEQHSLLTPRYDTKRRINIRVPAFMSPS